MTKKNDWVIKIERVTPEGDKKVVYLAHPRGEYTADRAKAYGYYYKKEAKAEADSVHNRTQMKVEVEHRQP